MLKTYRLYRVYKALAPAIVVAYAVVAITATFIGGRELFPFFNWSLFSTGANPKRDTVLVVHSLNGRVLDSPRFYYDMPETFAGAANRSAAVGKTLDRIERARRKSRTDDEARYRAVVERVYLREAQAVRYDITRITYDPIDRLQTGQIKRTEIIASYEKRDVR